MATTLIRHAVYAPVRRAKDDGHEFALFSEAQMSPWFVPVSDALRGWDEANPVIRIARFELTEIA